VEKKWEREGKCEGACCILVFEECIKKNGKGKKERGQGM